MTLLHRGRTREGDDIEVIALSDRQWEKAARRSLKALGLTWDQLAEQARTGDFSSWRTRQLWLTIGHRRRAE